MRNIIRLVIVLLVLCACEPVEPTRLTNTSGLLPDLSFQLIDENKQLVTQQDYRGQLVVLFFGFTHCSDVCPTAMHKLSSVMGKLATSAAGIKVLFVSVDPDRDSFSRLKRYTEIFGPNFVGLTMDKESIRQMSKRYRVTFGYGEANAEGAYDVSHSGAMFIFDRHGKARLLARPSSSIEDIFVDFQRLLAE